MTDVALIASDRSAGSRPHRRLWVSAAAIAALLALLGLCQALLPALAAQRLASSLERDAGGVSVTVEATPAVELLLGHADAVRVHIDRLNPTGANGGLVALLAHASHADRVNATVSRLYSHGLLLEDVSFQKRGAAVTLTATVTRNAIEEALPARIRLGGVPEGRSAFRLTLSASLFGHALSSTVRLRATRGRLELSPDLPFASLLHFVLFEDPQVAVDTIAFSRTGERYRFQAEGHYT